MNFAHALMKNTHAPGPAASSMRPNNSFNALSARYATSFQSPPGGVLRTGSCSDPVRAFLSASAMPGCISPRLCIPPGWGPAPGAREGVVIVMLTAPDANAQVSSPLEVASAGVLLRPLKTFTFG